MQKVTWLLDKVFSALNLNVQDGPLRLQLFICGLNFMFSIYPMVCYFIYKENVHVLFWMGMAPQYANLSTPFSLCALNVGVNVVTTLKMATKSTQRMFFVLFCVLGSINMGAGAWVLIEAARVSEDLIHYCGSTTLTARIEAEWQRLNTFYSQCQVTAGKMIYIQECPNYAVTFPNRAYANYIEDMEIDYSCVGFCQFWAPPLYNLDADRTLRCATALGEQMTHIGKVIGLPTMAIGTIIVTIGMCLAMYDHL